MRKTKKIVVGIMIIALLLVTITGCATPHATGDLSTVNLSSTKNMTEKLELITQNVVRITNTIEGGKIVGTGFYMNNGYLVTNSHVVDTQGDITVSFADGSSTAATLYANDVLSDVAILKTEETRALALSWEDKNEVVLSDTLYAIGYGLDLAGDASVTQGICSASRRAQEIVYIQTDAAVNGGFSGGPLINESGKVIGLIALANSSASISMAISQRSAVSIIESLIAAPQVEYVAENRPQNALSNMLQEVGIHIDGLYHEEHHWDDHNQRPNDNTTTSTAKPEIESILFSNETIELSPTEQKLLTVQVSPGIYSAQDLIWKSSDESIAEYRAGQVIAKAKGECVITATAPNGVSASCTVVVRVEAVDNGMVGDNITWTYYKDGTLIISGQGEITYDRQNIHPDWHPYHDEATAIIVEEGITSLPESSFADFNRCKSVQLPSTLKIIQHFAFGGCLRLSSIVLPKSVEKIGLEVFMMDTIDLYFEGTQAEFEQIEKFPQYWDEKFVLEAPVEDRDRVREQLMQRSWDYRESGLTLYYSETEQEGCWRYVDGTPTKW